MAHDEEPVSEDDASSSDDEAAVRGISHTSGSEIRDMTQAERLRSEDVAYLREDARVSYYHQSVRRWTIGGGIVGLLIGLVFLPVGLLIGPIGGAIVCRYWRRIALSIDAAEDKRPVMMLVIYLGILLIVWIIF